MLKSVIPLASGSKLLEYEVRTILGMGGFGITYLCRDRNLDNLCVVKEFAPRGLVARDENGDLQPASPVLAARFLEGKKNFLTEARRLGKFNHPNIVRVTRFFEAHATAYFAMSFETGLTLRDLIKSRDTTFTDEEVAGIAEPLCYGVLELHKADLIHRDIKPDNIIIRPDGAPVLIDLGAAVQIQSDAEIKHPVIATPAYAPLEQLTPNGKLGPWTDIYALGATLYELISGKTPISSVSRSRGEELLPATEVGRGRLSDRLLNLIDSAMSLDYLERPQSIAEFLRVFSSHDDAALRTVLEDIDWKMVNHFANWAKPNNHLYLDEVAAFCVIFPIVDLSWRIGKGIPDGTTFDRLFGLTAPDSLKICEDELHRRGFELTRGNLTREFVRRRLEEYSACYLIDRQSEKWTYELLRKQLVRNCLFEPIPVSIIGFSELMENVINRARGRVKKYYAKTLRRVFWVKTETGWNREVRLAE